MFQEHDNSLNSHREHSVIERHAVAVGYPELKDASNSHRERSVIERQNAVKIEYDQIMVQKSSRCRQGCQSTFQCIPCITIKSVCPNASDGSPGDKSPHEEQAFSRLGI